jgi:TDG/mug DNA glycosylase family protein
MTAHFSEQSHIIHPLAPVWDSGSTAIILGTMPSPASRAAGFYYMHPQNRFWPVLSAVFNEPLVFANNDRDSAAAAEERRSLILRHHLALWDVLAGCDITGADDASIRNPVPNDFSEILAGSDISRVYCTGKTSYRYYMRLCLPETGIDAVCLPSTSAANRGRWPLAELIRAYGVIAE